MATRLYNWPKDKKGRVHSIPYATHTKDVRLKRAGKPYGKGVTYGKGVGKAPTKPAVPAWRKRPITPGSSLTRGEVYDAARAAAKTQYGPVETQQKQLVGQAQTYARDVGGKGGFYDQYLAELARHNRNVTTVAQQANAAAGALPGQVTGLAQADVSSLQAQANAQAAARGMGAAGDLTQMASNATAVRQAMAGSYAAQQAAQGAAAQNYADTLAHVVGATQKLSGQAVAQGKIATAKQTLAETERQKGAAVEQSLEATKAGEAKNVLAMQVAGLGAATKAATAAETTRHHKAEESAATKRIRQQRRTASQSARNQANKRASSGPFAGLTEGQIQGLSNSRAQSLVNRYNQMTHPPKTSRGGGGGGGAGGKGPSLTLGQQGSGLTQASMLKGFMQTARKGAPLPKQGRPGWKNIPRSQAYAMTRVRNYVGGQLKNPWLVNAAGDAVYVGHLWGNTERNLKKGGYSPKQVAAALGVPTYDAWLKTPGGKLYLGHRHY